MAMGAVNQAVLLEVDSIPAATQGRSAAPALRTVWEPPPSWEFPVAQPGLTPSSVQRQPRSAERSVEPMESRTSYDRTSVLTNSPDDTIHNSISTNSTH